MCVGLVCDILKSARALEIRLITMCTAAGGQGGNILHAMPDPACDICLFMPCHCTGGGHAARAVRQGQEGRQGAYRRCGVAPALLP